MTDILAELERQISQMPPAAKAKLDALLEPELSRVWTPQPGPQTKALESQADILLYGGQAGGGKTDLLLGLAFTEQSRSVIFRAQYVDLRGVEERSIEIQGARDGYNGADMVWRLPDRVVEFGALAKPGQEQNWQGRPHDFVGFDEGAQLPVSKVQFVLGWLRSAKPGQRCRCVIASNPPMGDEGAWLIEWFAPWLDPMFPNPAKDGELRWALTAADGKTVWVDGPGEHEHEGKTYEAKSRTFIPARLDDNAYLRETGYRRELQNLPEPLRSQLLEGDFLAGRQDHDWQVIPSAWVKLAQERWPAGKPEKARMSAIGVDVAQGGADDTVLARLYGTWFDTLLKYKGIDTKDGPAVAALVTRERKDGAAINIDMTGGWGGSARDHLVGNRIECNGVVFSEGSYARSRDKNFGFVNRRAELWWLFREALDPKSDENIALPPDNRLFAQLTAPRWELRGEKIKIESKIDIKERLGASTDDADAVIMAWDRRNAAAPFTDRHRNTKRVTRSAWAA